VGLSLMLILLKAFLPIRDIAKPTRYAQFARPFNGRLPAPASCRGHAGA